MEWESIPKETVRQSRTGTRPQMASQSISGQGLRRGVKWGGMQNSHSVTRRKADSSSPADCDGKQQQACLAPLSLQSFFGGTIKGAQGAGYRTSLLSTRTDGGDCFHQTAREY